MAKISSMICEVCARSVLDGITLHRQNRKGFKGIWRCDEHNRKKVPAETQKLLDLISGRKT